VIRTIIFSFNRPIQLELLLKSIVKYDSFHFLKVSVLYGFSSSEYEAGYQKLMEQFPNVFWIREQKHSKTTVWPFFPLYWRNYYWWLKYKSSRYAESNFKYQLIQMLDWFQEELVMFLTDDSMFYKTISIPAFAVRSIQEKPEMYSFSLRHGENIEGGHFQYTNKLLQWNIYSGQDHHEWNYPFSVDGQVYGKSFIQRVIRKVNFKNPNSLEGNIACFIKDMHLLPIVFCNPVSCLVGFELNRVQNYCMNNNLNIDSKYLNSLFIDGYSMEINFDNNENSFFRPLKFQVNAVRENELLNIITLK